MRASRHGEPPVAGVTFLDQNKAAPGGAPTPTGSLTTRRSILLMADQNPTVRSATVTGAPLPPTVAETRIG
jgi:hypothetical protein